MITIYGLGLPLPGEIHRSKVLQPVRPAVRVYDQRQALARSGRALPHTVRLASDPDQRKGRDPRSGLALLVRAVAARLLAERFGSTRLLEIASERLLEDPADLAVLLRGQDLRRAQQVLVHVGGHFLASHSVSLSACQQSNPQSKTL